MRDKHDKSAILSNTVKWNFFRITKFFAIPPQKRKDKYLWFLIFVAMITPTVPTFHTVAAFQSQ